MLVGTQFSNSGISNSTYLLYVFYSLLLVSVGHIFNKFIGVYSHKHVCCESTMSNVKSNINKYSHFLNNDYKYVGIFKFCSRQHGIWLVMIRYIFRHMFCDSEKLLYNVGTYVFNKVVRKGTVIPIPHINSGIIVMSNKLQR